MIHPEFGIAGVFIVLATFVWQHHPALAVILFWCALALIFLPAKLDAAE